jgi:hypothetical protein
VTMWRERYYEALDDLRTAGEMLIRALGTDYYEAAAREYEAASARARAAQGDYAQDEGLTMPRTRA